MEAECGRVNLPDLTTKLRSNEHQNLILKSMAAGGALALALFAFGPGRRNSAPDTTSQSDTYEEIDAHIERRMERLNVPVLPSPLWRTTRSHTYATLAGHALAVKRLLPRHPSSSAR